MTIELLMAVGLWLTAALFARAERRGVSRSGGSGRTGAEHTRYARAR